MLKWMINGGFLPFFKNHHLIHRTPSFLEVKMLRLPGCLARASLKSETAGTPQTAQAKQLKSSLPGS